MTRTHFSNFDGLPWPTEYSNYSTAANLLTLGRAAMSSPIFRSIVDQRTYRISAGSGHHAYLWRNLNPLLGHYPGAIGIKSGYTGPPGSACCSRPPGTATPSSASRCTAPVPSTTSTEPTPPAS